MVHTIISTNNGWHGVAQVLVDPSTGKEHMYQVRWRTHELVCCGRVLARYDRERAPVLRWVSPHGPQDATAVQCGRCGSMRTAMYKATS